MNIENWKPLDSLNLQRIKKLWMWSKLLWKSRPEKAHWDSYWKVIYVMRGLVNDHERIQRFRCNICDKDFHFIARAAQQLLESSVAHYKICSTFLIILHNGI